MTWKRLDRKIVYANKWIEVCEDQIENEMGDPFVYTIIRKDDFAIIVPWDGTRFTIVGQYRYAVDYFSWEFPMGHFEHANLEETARAELQEEAGLAATRMEEIGKVNVVSGNSTQAGRIFLATGLSSVPTNRGPLELGMQVKTVTPQEFIAMVQEGQILDGPTLATWAIVQAKGTLAQS